MKKVIDDKLIFMRGMLTEIENEIASLKFRKVGLKAIIKKWEKK